MRAVQITRFGGPEVLDIVDLPDPVPGHRVGQVDDVEDLGTAEAGDLHSSHVREVRG